MLPLLPQELAATSARLGVTKELQAACVRCITLMHHISNRMCEAKEVRVVRRFDVWNTYRP